MCGNENIKKESILTIMYEVKIEEFLTYHLSTLLSNIRIQPTLCTATKRYKDISLETNKWRLIRVLYSLSRNIEEKMICNLHPRQNKYIFINRITAKRSQSISSILKSVFVKGANICCYYQSYGEINIPKSFGCLGEWVLK